MLRLILAVGFMLSSNCSGQSSATSSATSGATSVAASPAFEVASIKVNKGTIERGRERVDALPGTLTMRNVSLRTAMKWAYNVRDFQITGPNFLDVDRFDIVAKATANATDGVPVEEMRPMLQALLANRFKVVLHRETKTLTVYSLVVAKGGTKCTPSTSEGESSFAPPKPGTRNIAAVRMPVSWLLDPLSQFLHALVIDETGLKGRFDCNVDTGPYIPQDGQDADPVAIVLLGMQEQLGLKVEPKKAPVEMLIVDRVEKVPTEN